MFKELIKSWSIQRVWNYFQDQQKKQTFVSQLIFSSLDNLFSLR